MKAFTATNLCSTGVTLEDLIASDMLERGPISCRRMELLAFCGELRKGVRSERREESWERLSVKSSGAWEICCIDKGSHDN